MSSLREHLRVWLPGLVLCLAGVAGVRLLAPLLHGRMQAMASVVAYLLVPIGLALIARQIHRRALARMSPPV